MEGTKNQQLRETKSAALLCALQAAFFCVAVYYKSIYLTVCGIAALWMGAFQFYLIWRNGRRPGGRKPGRFWGLVLFPPAAALCGFSILPLFFQFRQPLQIIRIGTVCILTAAQAITIGCSLVRHRKDQPAQRYTMQGFDAAVLCILLAALVSQLLLFGPAEEWPQMVCLTGCVMGGTVLLMGCNMLLCAVCGFRSTKESLLLVRNGIRERQRLLHRLSVGKDGLMVAVKLVMSVASFSFFMFANALFSCGIGLARYTALQMQGKSIAGQLKLYRRVAVILCFSGLCYAGYSVRLFFGGSPGQYGMVMALAIAAYTFVEFGVQLYELLKLRRQRDLEAEALRLVSFSGILVSFVLTQTAIMSFSEPGEHNFSDGLAGVVFGGLVVLVGLISLLRYTHFLKSGFLEKEDRNI